MIWQESILAFSVPLLSFQQSFSHSFQFSFIAISSLRQMLAKLTKLLLLLFLLACLPEHRALADTGPKPTMEFTFKPETTNTPVVIDSGVLYECEQSDCSDAAPLQQVGPQRFTCDATSCSALAYGFSRYHKMEIEFSDGKTRQSNIFQTAGFDSKYTVTVRSDDLLVESQLGLSALPPFGIILITCICAVVGLSVIAVVIIFIVRRAQGK